MWISRAQQGYPYSTNIHMAKLGSSMGLNMI